MNEKGSYQDKYNEVQIIGRGNFGSAHLILDRETQKKSIAKKIVIPGLTDKEIQSAFNEVNLLSKLRHPNIVEYIACYLEDETLIIIMEFCEEGDLSYHIKQHAKKNHYFEEKLILNWFLQIALALDYIHQNKILHRDIKSSNIFLTSDGKIKIGDFGISKILNSTHEQANTILGTPYYMSPEVCENKPYSYKSDIWALGCVLYELCTLKQAFKAENLFSLIMKIIKEEHEQIPSHYSIELKQLVAYLLEKDFLKRISLQDIFALPFIKRAVKEFMCIQINNNKKLSVPSEMSSYGELTIEGGNKIHNENEMLTPVQRLKKRKEEEARKRAEELKLASEKKEDNLQAKKNSNIRVTKSTSYSKDSINGRYNLQNQSKIQNKESNVTLQSLRGSYSSNYNEPNFDENSNHPAMIIQNTNNLAESQLEFLPQNSTIPTQIYYNNAVYDERPIKPAKNQSYLQKLEEEDMEMTYKMEFDEDFLSDEQENFKANIKNTKERKSILNSNQLSKSKYKNSEQSTIQTSQGKLHDKKNKIINLIGAALYEKAYSTLKKQYELKRPEKARKELAPFIEEQCLKNIEEIYFLELLNNNN